MKFVPCLCLEWNMCPNSVWSEMCVLTLEWNMCHVSVWREICAIYLFEVKYVLCQCLEWNMCPVYRDRVKYVPCLCLEWNMCPVSVWNEITNLRFCGTNLPLIASYAMSDGTLGLFCFRNFGIRELRPPPPLIFPQPPYIRFSPQRRQSGVEIAEIMV